MLVVGVVVYGGYDGFFDVECFVDDFYWYVEVVGGVVGIGDDVVVGGVVLFVVYV